MIEGTTCAMVCVWRSEENIVESVLFFRLYIGSWVESQFARLAQQTSLSTETSPHSLSQTSFISLQFPLIFFFQFLFPFSELMSVSNVTTGENIKVKSCLGTRDDASFQRSRNGNAFPCMVISSDAILESSHAPLSIS